MRFNLLLSIVGVAMLINPSSQENINNQDNLAENDAVDVNNNTNIDNNVDNTEAAQEQHEKQDQNENQELQQQNENQEANENRDPETFDIEENGAVADDDSFYQMYTNAGVINEVLAKLEEGDTLYVPNKTFHTLGGIYVSGLSYNTIRIDGTLKFSDNRSTWPTQDDGVTVLDCLTFDNLENVVFTSNGKGTLDGNGKNWWGSLNYMQYAGNRPRILKIDDSAGLIVENLLFKDSPFWSTDFQDVIDVTIRHCDVDARFKADASSHDELELQAYNTDGFDIAGENIHIHDCNIWNSDDCIAVKDLGDGGGNRARCSQNWLVERVNASGGGLTIGSIGSTSQNTCVKNITFRHCHMESTWKGIYLKSRGPYIQGNTATIQNVLFENIVINNPVQWALWIGPAQQISAGGNQDVCSLLWPEIAGTQCPVQPGVSWENITLRNITINNPKMSPGVIIGNETNPMKNVVMENVVVTDAKPGDERGREPWGSNFYACYGVEGTAIGKTYPVPNCFDGGKQCTHSVIGSVMGEPCSDQDVAVARVTLGYLTSCAQAIALEPTSCSDSSNPYYDVARELCQASCGMCGETTAPPTECADNDAMIEQLTSGQLTSCAAAIALMPDACTDSSNAYYNAAHAYCRVSCSLCGQTRLRRTAAGGDGKQCGIQLTYVCDVDDMCTPVISAQGISPAEEALIALTVIAAIGAGGYGALVYYRRSRGGYLKM